MTAVRHTFGSGMICEIRTARDSRGRWAARVYVVQEGSLVLQRLVLGERDEYVASSPAGAHDLALGALLDRFGPESCKPAHVPTDAGFQIVEERRSA